MAAFKGQTSVQMSVDGGETWEEVRLPSNCLPFHQTQLVGHYEENGTMYRKVKS